MVAPAGGWADEIFAHLKRTDVRIVGYVPDAGLQRLIERCIADPDIHDVVLTTEEEGIALIVGAALGGQRGALLMQSSGVGNCVNMFSLIRGFGVPCLVVVTMRGEAGEFNPWQVPMGSITNDVLGLTGCRTYRVETAADVDRLVGAGCDHAFDNRAAVAIVLAQQLIGPKQWTRE